MGRRGKNENRNLALCLLCDFRFFQLLFDRSTAHDPQPFFYCTKTTTMKKILITETRILTFGFRFVLSLELIPAAFFESSAFNPFIEFFFNSQNFSIYFFLFLNFYASALIVWVNASSKQPLNTTMENFLPLPLKLLNYVILTQP